MRPVSKQVRGTTRCVNSDRGGQNCKICLNALFSFISSHHLTKPQTFCPNCLHFIPLGSIRCHLQPLGNILYYFGCQGTIGYHLAPLGTIEYHWVPFGIMWYYLVPLGTIWYHFGQQGKVWERFGQFQVCQEAD